MTWEPRPLPKVTPETAPFWEATVDGRLLLRECDDCGLVYYYPRILCPDCFSDDVTWVEATGNGTIYSYSISEKVDGWPAEELPLIVTYVELEEGPRLITNLVNCDPEEVSINAPVEVVFEETQRGDVAIPVFVLR